MWIEAGKQTIYEYSDEAQVYFGGCARYNDYQITRFLEDFFDTFSLVGKSVPRKLYDMLAHFEAMTDTWKNSHLNDEDEAFEQFYEKEYCKLTEWYTDRIFDSGHLIGGPRIGCFRCGDRIKICWFSNGQLENGESIWTSPEGIIEMDYHSFVLAVSQFWNSFSEAMDEQVQKAVTKDWQEIVVDKERLVAENEERKADFSQKLRFLTEPQEKTDWEDTLKMYEKMRAAVFVYQEPDLSQASVAYYCVNYMQNGKVDVLAETEGYYQLSTLHYVQEYGYNWYRDSQ